MCDFKTHTRGSLWNHKKRVHEDVKHYCSHCDYINDSILLIKYHVERKHLQTKSLKCDECNYETSIKINLTRHKRYKHDTVQIKCNLCEFSGSRCTVGDHMRNRHGDLKKCNDCDYTARTNLSLSTHHRIKHQGITFDCDECGKKLSSKPGLKKHKDNKHKGVRFKCPKCDYKATLEGNLKIHEQAMHENLKYPCERCSYIASTPRSLRWHSEKCKDLKISQN